MANLVYRHNRITRLTHWIDALALMILFMSGLMIFNAHPHLYWGSTSAPEKAFLSIGATNEDGDLARLRSALRPTARHNGIAWRPARRARTYPARLSKLADCARLLLACERPPLALLFRLAVCFKRAPLRRLQSCHRTHAQILFTSDDAKKVPAMIAYYLHLRKSSPQEGEYNPLQKMAYTSVFVILTPLVLLSGMAMSPQLNVAFNWLPAAFGGRQSARAIHFILAFGFLFFTFGHVFMVLTQGLLNNMRSMTTGWYLEKIPSREQPPRATGEPRPEIAKALKGEESPAQTDVPPTATIVEDEKAQSVPAASPEAPASDLSAPEKEEEKGAEPKS